ncbi:hypothetical protein PI126_g18180 [Phytophthora idaei]|nr:hypothetical protein PI126_g18180 [Phytophthora idaei]
MLRLRPDLIIPSVVEISVVAKGSDIGGRTNLADFRPLENQYSLKNGINECLWHGSFPHSSIAGIPVFQQLQFLFDFIFCAGMVIPLVVMSCIPFLNVIQTRMMYNEGFSKVMSDSSQCAFSLGNSGWHRHRLAVQAAVDSGAVCKFHELHGHV